MEDQSSQEDIEYPVAEDTSSPKYNHLATKFNRLHVSYFNLKPAHEKLQEELRNQKKKTKEWKTYNDAQEKDYNQTLEKNQRLEVEVQSLQKQVETRSSSVAPASSALTSVHFTKKERVAKIVVEVGAFSPGLAILSGLLGTSTL